MREKLDLDELMWRMTGARGIGKDSIDMPISEIGALIARIRELESASQPGGGEAVPHQHVLVGPSLVKFGPGKFGEMVIKRASKLADALRAALSAGNGGAEGDGNAA
ncbi:hypothetical protein [Cupriavidus sp.]|uniref:hypothetical protein n=1 Tax=Cupriavidus sp. TaxID=1873897 RepID=UPI0031D21E3E